MAYQLDAAIAGAPFERVVRVFGLRLAESRRGQAARINRVAFYERVLDCDAISPGKIEVVLIGTDSIGVPVYLKLPAEMASQYLRYFLERRF